MRRIVPVLVVVAVVSALGGAAGASHDFPDVPPSNPFHDDISWLADSGITGGFTDGTFRPTDPVTRQSMAAFLHRMSGEGSTPRVVDAAELADRPASDFDDAETLQGNSPEQLQPNVFHAGSTSEVTITGTSPASSNTVVSMSLPGGTYVVDVSGSVRTTAEAAQVTCLVLGGTVLRQALSLDDVYAASSTLPDTFGPMSGTAVVDLVTATNVRVACYHGTLSGTGSVLARDTSLIATSVEDL